MRQKDGKLKLNKQDKPVVLMLGTGWGAHSLVKVRGLPCAAGAGARVGGRWVRLHEDKPVVLVLGTGWGAHSLVKVGLSTA